LVGGRVQRHGMDAPGFESR